MKSKAVSRVMSTLLLIGVHSVLLLSIFAITPNGLAHEESQPPGWGLWLPDVPSPEQVTLDFWMAGKVAYVDVTIQFYSPCVDITDWGTVTEIGHNIWVDSEIWFWTGICILMIPPPTSHTYELGSLESGNYTFTFKAWNETVKSIDFTITDYEPVHNLNTSLNYTSIQEAIDANETLNGHTIFVEEGTYYEHIIINKSLMLIGEDRAKTIIDAGRKDTVVSVTADNVTVSGFTIRNAGGYLIWSCVELGASRTTVKGNIITESYIGILVGGDHNAIIDNTIVATGSGMVLSRSIGNILRNNTMIDNSMSSFAVWGESLSDFLQDIDTSNLVDGRPIYYLVNQSNLIVNSSTSPDIGYLALINSTKVTVKDLELRTKNDVGILLAYTTHSIIQNLNISNSFQGVSLYASSHNKIIGNRISDTYDGIWLDGSNNNELIDNEISSNAYGINLASSEGNDIKDNVMRANRESGILIWGSNCNVIRNNAILENHYGIRLGNFVSRPESTGNIIVGNFISNNDHQVGFENPHYSSNTWDKGYPDGGNYWNNYTGVDSNHDGIGDSSHNFQENNIDHYPLMGRFSDFNATSEFRVQTICNSSISDFQFNETAISFNVSGEEGTTGFCRICIPTALMDTYKVFVNGTEVPHALLPCSNSTHSYLYFTYNHSTQEVIIVPEFPTFLILPLFMIATLLAVIVYARKHSM